MTTSALRTEMNYLEIMFMLHMGMLYRMINFTQKSGRAKQEKKMMNLMILMKNGEVQQRAASKK